MYTLEQLRGKSLEDLQGIAKELDVPGWDLFQTVEELAQAILANQSQAPVQPGNPAPVQPAPEWDAFEPDPGQEEHPRVNGRGIAAAIVAGVLVLLLACGVLTSLGYFVVWPMVSSDEVQSKEVDVDKFTKDFDDKVESVMADDSVEEFVIDMPSREGHRLNADGVAKPGDAEAFRDQIAEQASHDPLTLYVYYMASPLGEKRPLESEKVIARGERIEDGNVYSELGVQAYKDWLFLWELADIEAVDEIKFQSANTGVDGTSITQSNGVTGDKSGYDITYSDATGEKCDEHSALDRCTQPTFGKKVPFVPEGPTDCWEDPSGHHGDSNGASSREHSQEDELATSTDRYKTGNLEEHAETEQAQNTTDDSADSGSGEGPAGSHAGGNADEDDRISTEVEDDTVDGATPSLPTTSSGG